MAWSRIQRIHAHAARVKSHNYHRRSGAKKGLSRRVVHARFRHRMVNAPKRVW